MAEAVWTFSSELGKDFGKQENRNSYFDYVQHNRKGTGHIVPHQSSRQCCKMISKSTSELSELLLVTT